MKTTDHSAPGDRANTASDASGRDRRAFLKHAGLAGLCACSWQGATSAAGQQQAAQPPAQPPEPLAKRWVATLLPLLATTDREAAAKAIRGCSGPHYDALGLDEMIGRFKGNLDGFLQHLQREWGWVVTRGPEPGVVLIDENKPNCVCPLLPKPHSGNLGLLCYCSEGIAERMFSQVVGRPVRATVVASVLRGHPTCRYRVDLSA